ncbi:hypothetical protein [Parabacteroides johnsonii]|uniref:Uncharacterized protein n=1 Tax=Parabacteroides johnsonii CL02T12C29 TaxID=999419 RepID=K5ZVS7_9BACT|nr:hypothetical protein [Parabacteroides johnsonii]EKN07533.1 hypothetical protein HMPREF1077_02645 [Parabacteroides johnsonii CL02T12C29]
MPIVIKEIHIRTVVERRIVTEEDVSEEIIRKIENRVVDKLSARENGQPDARRQTRRNR